MDKSGFSRFWTLAFIFVYNFKHKMWVLKEAINRKQNIERDKHALHAAVLRYPSVPQPQRPLRCWKPAASPTPRGPPRWTPWRIGPVLPWKPRPAHASLPWSLPRSSPGIRSREIVVEGFGSIHGYEKKEFQATGTAGLLRIHERNAIFVIMNLKSKPWIYRW